MDSVYSFNMNTNFALPKVAHSSMMGNTSALDGSGRSTATQVNQCQNNLAWNPRVDGNPNRATQNETAG
jgi:hypothetical protein